MKQATQQTEVGAAAYKEKPLGQADLSPEERVELVQLLKRVQQTLLTDT